MENTTPGSQPDQGKKRRNYPSTIQKGQSFQGEVPPGRKYCSACATVPAIEVFVSHTGNIRPYCIPCTNILERSRTHSSDKAYQRERMMKRNYHGFSADQYNALFESQGGLCAICKRPETYVHHGNVQPLSIDHCHKTHRVRALLCARCNAALGLLEENPDVIQALLDYAKQWQNT